MIASSAALAALLALALALDEERPNGVLLHAAFEGAYLDSDPSMGAALGAGVETAPFGLFLAVPLWLRVVDLPPPVDDPDGPCRYIRCDDFAPGGTFAWASLSRIVEELRLFRAGDLFHARAGPLYATLAHGLVLDGATNRLEFDRRASGAYLEANVPFANLGARAIVLDLLAPQELFAARVDGSPFAPFVSEEAGWLGRFAGRFTLGVEGGLDATAPVEPSALDAGGAVRAGAATHPVGALVVDATWALLDGGLLQVAPFVAASSMTGLSPIGDGSSQLGVGGAAGVDVTLDAVFAVLDVSATAALDGPGHRRGLFDLAYSVERRRALFGASVPGGGVVRVPAPGGFGGRLSTGLSVLSAARIGALLDIEAAPGGNDAEVFIEGKQGPVRLALRFVQRGFADVPGLFTWGEGSILLAESAFSIWGPFSVYGRWLRAPRFQGGTLSLDDDVFVGLSFDLALSPLW